MIRACILVFSLLLIAGCAGIGGPLPTAPAAAVLHEKLRDNGRRWQQLDTLAKVGLTREGKFYSTQQFILAEKPERLRVDVLSLFGQLALQLSVDQDRLQILDKTSLPPRAYAGPLDDDLLSRITRLPLSVSQLVRLLLYDPPVFVTAAAGVEQTADRYLLRLVQGQQQQIFSFDSQLNLRRSEYLHGGQSLLQIDYDEINPEDNFPRALRVQLPAEKIRLTLSLSDLRLNQPVPAKRFRLTLPEGAVPLLPVDAAGAGVGKGRS